MHLNFTSIMPHKITDKVKEFKIPSMERILTSMQPQKLANQLTDKLKGFKMPSFDRERIKKFFYETYLDVHENDSLEELKAKVKAKKAGQKK